MEAPDMRRAAPPRLARRLLERQLPPTPATEAAIGDLDEEFAAKRRTARSWAAVWYWKEALALALFARRLGHEGGNMRDWTGDLKYALRNLVRNPGFTAVVVFTLALGVGANSAMYSVVHAVLIQDLPYEGGADALVQLRQPSAAEGEADIGFSVLEVADYRARATALSELAEHHALYFNLTSFEHPVRIRTGVVSANYFDMLGVRPRLGRLFGPADERVGAEATMVLTHDFWQTRLGGDPSVIGTTLTMNQMPHVVIGVLPRVPLYPAGADVYITTSTCPVRSDPRWLEDRTERPLRVFGRLGQDADLGALNAELDTIARGLHEEHAADYPVNRAMSTLAVPLNDALVEDGRSTFLILLATSALVLVIAAINAANLMFARLVRRRRELSVRAALGAGRGRIVRLVLAEAGMAGLAGSAVGLAIASTGVRLLADFAARYTVRASEISIDVPVLAFALATGVAAGLAAGLVAVAVGMGKAALHGTRGNITEDVRGRRLQTGLIVGQVTVSFVLLVGAGLTIRSLAYLHEVDPGFATGEVLSMEIPPPLNRSGSESNRFYVDLLDRVRALGTVEEASVVMTFPLDGWGQMSTDIDIEGRASSSTETPLYSDVRFVTTGYFDTMDIELVEGRKFSETDQMDSAPVAIVNQAFVDRAFPDQQVIGRRISWNGGNTFLSIVGIVTNVKHYHMGNEPEPEIYQPALLMMNSLLVRAQSEPMALMDPIRDIVRELDPEQPVANVATMAERVTESMAPQRLVTSLLGFFASLATIITAAGIGGVVAFDVSNRMKELGIRMALGSSTSDAVGLLLRHELRSIACGLVIGLVTALFLGRYVEGLLYGVSPYDPWTFAGVAAMFVTIATAAALLPARRIHRIQPREVFTDS